MIDSATTNKVAWVWRRITNIASNMFAVNVLVNLLYCLTVWQRGLLLNKIWFRLLSQWLDKAHTKRAISINIIIFIIKNVKQHVCKETQNFSSFVTVLYKLITQSWLIRIPQWRRTCWFSHYCSSLSSPRSTWFMLLSFLQSL